MSHPETPDTDRVYVDLRSGRRYRLDSYGVPYWLPDPPPTRELRRAPHRDRRPSLGTGLAYVVVLAFAAAGALHLGRLLFEAAR